MKTQCVCNSRLDRGEEKVNEQKTLSKVNIQRKAQEIKGKCRIE